MHVFTAVRLSEGKHFSDFTKFGEHPTTKRLCIPPVDSYTFIFSYAIQQFVCWYTHTNIFTTTKGTEMEINAKLLLKISNDFVCFAVD